MTILRPLPDDLATGIAHNVTHVETSLLAKIGVPAGDWESGVAALDVLVEEARSELDPDQTRPLADLLGSYFGEALIQVCGGRWAECDDGPCVVVGPGIGAFPFNGVTLQLIDEDESILTYFNSIRSMVEARRSARLH